MKNYWPLVVMVTSLCLMLISNASAEERHAIAVVDVRLLLQKAPQSDEASLALKARFLPQEKALDDEALAIQQLEEELKSVQASLSKEEKITRERELRQRKRDRNRALEDYREDLRLERNAALDEVQRQVFDAIDRVREKKNIDVVIQDYVAASTKVDITQDVLVLLGQLLKESQEQGAKKEKAK